MKQPCAQDCPRRSEDCAATCKEWKDYVAERNARYEAIYKEKQIEEAFYQNKTKNIHKQFTHRRK